MSDFFDEHEKRSKNFVNEWAQEFKRRVEEKTPVKTGALQAGYQLAVTQDGFELSNTQPYFGYVEMGTKSQAPHRMAMRSFMEADQITKAAKERS